MKFDKDITKIKRVTFFETQCISSLHNDVDAIHVDGHVENDGHENDGPSKCPGMKLTDMKMQDMFQVSV